MRDVIKLFIVVKFVWINYTKCNKKHVRIWDLKYLQMLTLSNFEYDGMKIILLLFTKYIGIGVNGREY